MRRTCVMAILLGAAALPPSRAAAPTSTAPEITPPPPFAGTFEFGYDTWMLDGSRFQAGRYRRPSSTFWLSLSDVDARNETWFDALDFRANRLIDDTYDGELTLWTADVPSRWRMNFRHGTFVPEPLLGGVGTRSQLGFEGWVSPIFGMLFEVGYQNETVKQPLLARPVWTMYDAEELRASASLPIGVGDLYAEFSSLDYRDRTPFWPTGGTHQYGVTYSVMPSPRWMLGASARWANVHQALLPATNLFSAGLTLRYAPARNLDLDGRLAFRDVDLGPTVNSFVTESLTGSGTITWHPSKPVAIKLGAERGAYERQNAVAASENFGETRLWLRGDYRGPNSLRASARYQYRKLDGLDANAVPTAWSTASLFCDREHQLDVRASVALNEVGLAYGFWQWRERDWRGRGVTHTQHTGGVGLTWPARPNLQFTGDLFYASYATSAPLTGGLDADSVVFHAGAMWAPTPGWQLAADYHRVEGYFGQNTGQDFISFGCDVDLGAGRWLRLGYRREDYTNAAAGGLTYDADVLSVSLRTTL